MFDEDEIQSIGNGPQRPNLTGTVTGIGVEDVNRINQSNISRWKGWSIEQLVQAMDEIRALLPPLQLSKVNLEEEMLLQFHTLRSIQATILDDDTLEANKKATIANAVTSSLAKLADMQTSLYTSERFKEIENILIWVLKDMPEEQASQFLEKYGQLLQSASKE